MALFTLVLLHPGREKKSPYGNMSKGFSPAVFIMTSVGAQNPVISLMVIGIIKIPFRLLIPNVLNLPNRTGHVCKDSCLYFLECKTSFSIRVF